MENLTYKYIDECISKYMSRDTNLMNSLPLREKYLFFINFLKSHTQNVYERSYFYQLDMMYLQFVVFNNTVTYLKVNYPTYNPETYFTINIIAFQKKLIYYLIYIISILCDYNQTDSIIINICCDPETFAAHNDEIAEIREIVEYLKTLGTEEILNSKSKNTYNFSTFLSNNGPLITLIDKFMEVSSYKEIDAFEYYYFIYKIHLFLSNQNIKINYIVINDILAKGIGMKRGIINYHNYLIGKKLEYEKFSSLVLDDNITHIIKPVYSEERGALNTIVYLSEESESDFECGESLGSPSTVKTNFLNNKIDIGGMEFSPIQPIDTIHDQNL
jgi:hypothetical protein